MDTRGLRVYRRGRAILVLLAVLLALLAPAAVLAAPQGHGYFPRGPRIGPSMGPGGPTGLMGTVISAGEDELVLEIERHGRGRYTRTDEVTLAVDSDSILLAADLAPLALADLQADDEVLVAARWQWGAPVVQLLYAGTPEELADHSYRGRLVADEAESLELAQRWGDDELTVVVDENTIWLDHGQAGRPEELPEGIPLRILGTEQEDGTVRAVLVAAGHFGL